MCGALYSHRSDFTHSFTESLQQPGEAGKESMVLIFQMCKHRPMCSKSSTQWIFAEWINKWVHLIPDVRVHHWSLIYAYFILGLDYKPWIPYLCAPYFPAWDPVRKDPLWVLVVSITEDSRSKQILSSLLKWLNAEEVYLLQRPGFGVNKTWTWNLLLPPTQVWFHGVSTQSFQSYSAADWPSDFVELVSLTCGMELKILLHSFTFRTKKSNYLAQCRYLINGDHFYLKWLADDFSSDHKIQDSVHREGTRLSTLTKHWEANSASLLSCPLWEPLGAIVENNRNLQNKPNQRVS